MAVVPLQALQAAPLFRGLAERDLRQLAAQATPRSVGCRQIIYRAGDPARSVYLLRAGTVRLYQLIVQGQELSLGLIRPGEVFGLAALFGEAAYPRFAQALSPADCLVLPVTALLDLFGPQAGLALRLIRQVSSLLEQTAEQATALAFCDVRQRLAQALLAIYGEENGADESAARFTHNDLAALIGTTREHVTRLSVEFERAGYIAKQRGHVTGLRDVMGLRAEATAVNASG